MAYLWISSSLVPSAVEFTGYGRLLKRPMTVYEDICSEQGLEFSQSDEKILVKGRLKSGTYNVRGDISSQFITGLLFALPMLQGDSVINIIPPGATASDIREFETDYDDGRTEYEGKIVYDGMEYEFEIDGYSGAIRNWESEPVGRW